MPYSDDKSKAQGCIVALAFIAAALLAFWGYIAWTFGDWDRPRLD